ncbi:MAG: CehA/McbA family metallohydrolase [Verrucomicrobiales bacterium]|nr:CehA/McbA family metallohydrolase [Verrucomicrobiales bacterium]
MNPIAESRTATSPPHVGADRPARYHPGRRISWPGSGRLGVLVLTAVLPLPGARAADAPPPLPPGIIEFAGRAAHQHWYLFGAENRSALDGLNRELREAQSQMERAGDDAGRQTAAARGARAAGRLLELTRSCPPLLRLDLTAQPAVLIPAGPASLPGDTGALLVEVRSGGEGLRFSTGTSDLALPAGESSLVPIDVAAEGVTYVLVGLEHVPFHRTTLRLELRRPGQRAVSQPVDVETPPPGRLKLTVLSADSGRPTPAMVRLMWRTDGLQRRPANGIEFAPQFDRQGHASGVRAANLPGPLGAHFWCVPGPFDMALAPGVWQIGVRRGVEHEAVFVDVTVRSGETVEQTLRPRRWVDMRQEGWWSGDDHVHTRILSDDDARNVMAWVQAEDVHLANIVKMGDIYRTYFEQRGFGPAYRVVDGDHVLVPGQECPRTHDQIGHTLAMNITAMVRDPERYFLYDTVFDAVRAQGGLTGYAHVNSGMFHVHRDMSLNVPRNKVDFVEILQFNQLGTDLYYDFLNLGCKLTASAGSDVPWGGTIGEVRAYAYLGREPFSADHWFQAFGRGRTFTTSGPMLDLRVDDAFPGDEICVADNRPLRVRARAWGDPQRMAPVALEIVRHGEVLRSAVSSDPDAPDVRLDFTVEAGEGFWIAARARAGDGTSAHTTPVYVVREGLRFWKYDGLDTLLAKRRDSLRQIEQIVAEAQRWEAEGRLANDRYRQMLARQGPALLERVTQARQLYEELERTAAAERSRRRR